MVTTHDTHPSTPARLAVIGGGPVGLALALLAQRRCPRWAISVFDTRPADKDVTGDPRTLALSLGSVQLLERLGVWAADQAAPIRQIHVSQAPPTLSTPWGEPMVRIHAEELGVAFLGAVLGYGRLLAPLQAAFLRACAVLRGEDGAGHADGAKDGTGRAGDANGPGAAGGAGSVDGMDGAGGTAGAKGPRETDAPVAGLHARFGTPVAEVRTVGHGVQVTPQGGAPEDFDLAVIAEGGVFSEQSRKAITHDYHQTAWVGTVTLQDCAPGLAVERFTRDGPLALLPLPPLPGTDPRATRAALVWCVASADDPVAPLTDAQRLAVLAHRLPGLAGKPIALSALKSFALGLNAERSLVDGRVVRIGNAAQTLHPVAGQGLNLGLRDAYLLVDRLARFAAASDAGVTRALRGLEFARAPDRWSMIGATDFLARSFTWNAPGLAAARGCGLAALQALPPLKRAFARQMMFGWR